MNASTSARQQRDSTLWRLRLGRILPAPSMKTRPVARVKVGRAQAVHKPAVTARRVGPPLEVGVTPPPRTAQHSALHEPGHAVALAKFGIKFDHVELIGETVGRCAGIVGPTDGVGLESMIVATLAGGAASNPIDPCRPGFELVADGSDNDYRKAQDLIASLCRHHPFESGQPFLRMGLSADAIFQERTQLFVDKHQREIFAVANALLARSKLSAVEVWETICPA